jgi:hypothetical protein
MIQQLEMIVSVYKPFTTQLGGQWTISCSRTLASLAGKSTMPFNFVLPLKRNDADVTHSLILLNASA